MRYALKEVASLTFTVLIIWSTTDVFGDNRPIQKSVLRDSVLQHKLPTTKQLDLAQTLGESCTVRWNPDNGTPLNIRCAVNLKGKAVSIPSAAEQFLREYAGLFKIKDPASELKEEQTVTDELGKVHVRYSQELGGIRVWGSYLLLHFNPDFTLYAVSANSCPTPMPVNQSKIMRDLAESKVVSNISEGKEHCKLKSDLVVFPNNDQFFYAWAISIADSVKLEECWQYFIDAETGQILLKYRDVHDDGPAVGTGTSLDGSTKTINTYQYLGTYQMVDASKIMYTPPFTNFTGVILTVDCYNDTSTATDTIFYDYNSNNQFNESVYYRAGVDAHFNMGKIYDFFLSRFGRNSYSGLGYTVNTRVHYGYKVDNAFWNPFYRRFVFGDGGSLMIGIPYAMDVVAHEFAHGVNSWSADLRYVGQTGALNESFSDVFACLIDSSDWTLGEDVFRLSPGYLRNMQNPHLGYPPDKYIFGAQPMVMGEYDWLAELTGDDNGGVHGNSGIPNHAAYLVASQIGRFKMGKIWYRALTNYLGETSEFMHLFYATWSAANDLYGAGPERAAVEFAFDSVGIAPNANEWNLRYDDGSPEFVTWWPVANRGLAGEFFLPGTARLETVSFYIAGDNVGGSGNFDLKVFADSSGVPKAAPAFSAHTNVSGGLGDWIGFDLSSYNLNFSTKMYVAIFYDGINQPQLGKDTSSVWQSWYYNGSQWISDSAVYFIRAMVSTTLDADDVLDQPLPATFSLSQNVPNPFNNSTEISFAISATTGVNLEIYNVIGQLIYSAKHDRLSTGTHSFIWNGKDFSGHDVASGVYLYRVRTDFGVENRKMVLLK